MWSGPAGRHRDVRLAGGQLAVGRRDAVRHVRHRVAADAAGRCHPPRLHLASRRVGKMLRAVRRDQMEYNARMNAQMQETLSVSGALLVKLFGRTTSEDAEFADRATKVRDLGVRQATIGRWFFMALGVMSALGTAIVFWVGGVMVINERSEPSASWSHVASTSPTSTGRCPGSPTPGSSSPPRWCHSSGCSRCSICRSRSRTGPTGVDERSAGRGRVRRRLVLLR